eukprot:2785029-Pleurochrysis_carterae.AAC.6
MSQGCSRHVLWQRGAALDWFGSMRDSSDSSCSRCLSYAHTWLGPSIPARQRSIRQFVLTIAISGIQTVSPDHSMYAMHISYAHSTR